MDEFYSAVLVNKYSSYFLNGMTAVKKIVPIN